MIKAIKTLLTKFECTRLLKKHKHSIVKLFFPDKPGISIGETFQLQDGLVILALTEVTPAEEGWNVEGMVVAYPSNLIVVTMPEISKEYEAGMPVVSNGCLWQKIGSVYVLRHMSEEFLA